MTNPITAQLRAIFAASPDGKHRRTDGTPIAVVTTARVAALEAERDNLDAAVGRALAARRAFDQDARGAELLRIKAPPPEHDDGRVLIGDRCPCCSETVSDYGFGLHVPLLNSYRCPDCGEEWTDEWCAASDDECPGCGARHISPYQSEDL